MHEVRVVAEHDVGLLDHAAALDIDRVVGVDENIAHRLVMQQRLQRTQAKDLVEHFLRNAFAIDRS